MRRCNFGAEIDDLKIVEINYVIWGWPNERCILRLEVSIKNKT